MTTTTTDKIYDASHFVCFKQLTSAVVLKADWKPPTPKPFIASIHQTEQVLQTQPLTTRGLADLLRCSTTKARAMLKEGFNSYVDYQDLMTLEFCFSQGLEHYPASHLRDEIQSRIQDLRDLTLDYDDNPIDWWSPNSWRTKHLPKADRQEIESVYDDFEFLRVPVRVRPDTEQLATLEERAHARLQGRSY